MSVRHDDTCHCICHKHEEGVVLHMMPCCLGQCACGDFVKSAKRHELRTGHAFGYDTLGLFYTPHIIPKEGE